MGCSPASMAGRASWVRVTAASEAQAGRSPGAASSSATARGGRPAAARSRSMSLPRGTPLTFETWRRVATFATVRRSTGFRRARKWGEMSSRAASAPGQRSRSVPTFASGVIREASTSGIAPLPAPREEPLLAGEGAAGGEVLGHLQAPEVPPRLVAERHVLDVDEASAAVDPEGGPVLRAGAEALQDLLHRAHAGGRVAVLHLAAQHRAAPGEDPVGPVRSEEHTSELQSPKDLV